MNINYTLFRLSTPLPSLPSFLESDSAVITTFRHQVEIARLVQEVSALQRCFDQLFLSNAVGEELRREKRQADVDHELCQRLSALLRNALHPVDGCFKHLE